MTDAAGERRELRRGIRDLRARLIAAEGAGRPALAAELGALVARLAEIDFEAGREHCRRLFWSLNEESGESGWGSGEALGEILSRSEPLAREFGRMLVSLVAPGANHVHHPDLLAEAARGLDRVLAAFPATVPGARETLNAGDKKKEAAWML